MKSKPSGKSTKNITAATIPTITGARATLRTDVISRTPGAKDYTAGERLYGLVNGRLLWTFDMAAMGQPLGNHLAATLQPAHLEHQERADAEPAS